jgi:ABC-type amino acid transport substrate-binding protein
LALNVHVLVLFLCRVKGGVFMRVLVAVLYLAGLGVSVAVAQEAVVAQVEAPEELVVGTRHLPPFAIQGEDGAWRGISIELWRDIATELGYTYSFRDLTLEEMVEGLSDGSVDVVVGALTTTAEREEAFDFSQPFFSSGLGIAVLPERGNLLTGIVRRLFSLEFLQALLALVAVLLLVGALAWALERKRNPEQFGGPVMKGLGSGFWWAGVTMTTVGYGDKAPLTAGGRILGMVWMFASVISISAFTAGIASSLALGELNTRIHGPEDLPGKRVGTLADSTSETYLARQGVASRTYEDIRSALTALEDGRLDAVVYDAPLLAYVLNEEMEGDVSMLPHRFDNQNYALGLRGGSPLRESVNRVLLEKVATPEWDERLIRYLGES